MHLTLLDWLIVAASLLICFGPALFFGRRAGRNTSEFFASGRAVPWWLAGLSMVATTFSADTPNLVTDIVRRNGVAGNWVWWAFVLTGVATVFFYARLWRRSGVLTDLEFYELRYSGAAASALRGFRAVYLGLFFNCLIMAAVNLATCKIAGILFGLDRWQTLLLVGILNVSFAAFAGLWGVLVIDMIQFFMKMAAVIAAAYFAVTSPQVGGLHALVAKISARQGPGGAQLPEPAARLHAATGISRSRSSSCRSPCSGGRSGIPARSRAAAATSRSACWPRSRRRTRSARCCSSTSRTTCFRPWPWILVALCSLIVYPELSDIQRAFPNLDPKLLGHDIAYPAMLTFLPGRLPRADGRRPDRGELVDDPHAPQLGRVVSRARLLPAVRQPGRRPRRTTCAPAASPRSRLFACAAATVYLLDTAKDIFDVILQVGAGTGLLYLVRWFWWRVNAWCEIVAMVSSFAVSVLFLVLRAQGVVFSTHAALLIDGRDHDVCWVATAYLGPQTDREVLIDFWRKVRPAGPGWTRSARWPARPAARPRRPATTSRMALLGWVAGCTAIWSALFAEGNYLYGRMPQAILLFVVFLVAAVVLVAVVRRGYAEREP